MKNLPTETFKIKITNGQTQVVINTLISLGYRVDKEKFEKSQNLDPQNPSVEAILENCPFKKGKQFKNISISVDPETQTFWPGSFKGGSLLPQKVSKKFINLVKKINEASLAS